MKQEKIGKFIAELRKEKNMTQQQLADKLNVTDRAIGNWENGRRLPDYSILNDLCNILDINVNELLNGEKIMKEDYNKKTEDLLIELTKKGEETLNKLTDIIRPMFDNVHNNMTYDIEYIKKVLEEEKHTNDLVDIVLSKQPISTKTENIITSKSEHISSIAQKSFTRERELMQNRTDKKALPKKDKITTEKNKPIKEEMAIKELVNLTFSKALTEREQMVFDYFMQNKGHIVYAKDLAGLLGLPRDYVYKYIKNLRAKIEGDKLQNAENGGYILNV